MAQNINIPIAFEWRPRPVSWKVVTAEVTGWALESAQPGPHFQAKVEEHGTHYRLEVPWWAFPQETLRLLQLEEAREFRRSYPLELLVCSAETQRDIQREANPWPMREEFLRLKRDTKALLAFLNKWGVWGPTWTVRSRGRSSVSAPAEVKIPPTRRQEDFDVEKEATETREPMSVGQRIKNALDLPPPSDLDPKRLPAEIRPAVWGQALAESMALDRKALNYLFPFEVWQFQKQCRDALRKPAGEWLPTQKLLALVPRPQYPHYVRQAVNCQRAILDTIIIDLLRKVKFRLCARPDCRTPFAIESRHHREYCRPYCAHIESLRRRRKAARKEALHGKEVTYAKR